MITAMGKSRRHRVLLSLPVLVFLLVTALANLTHTCIRGHHARLQHDHSAHLEPHRHDHSAHREPHRHDPVLRPGKGGVSARPDSSPCQACQFLNSGNPVLSETPRTPNSLPPAGCLPGPGRTLHDNFLAQLFPPRGPPSFS